MKKFISILMAVTMIATLVFAFPAPANATNSLVYVDSPYYETYFSTNDSYVYAELPFNISHSGYYIIQSFGFFDEYGSPVEADAFLELYSSDEFICEGYSDTGYDGGFFINPYLEGNETYRLYVWFSTEVDFIRISFTHAEYYYDYGRTEYAAISRIFTDYNGGSSINYGFPGGEQRAVVFLVDHFASPDMPVRNYVVNATCCSCTRMLLIVPHGHNVSMYDGSPVVFDASPNSSGAPLTESIPYYLVIYRGDGALICPDHYDYDSIEVTIEPADTQ